MAAKKNAGTATAAAATTTGAPTDAGTAGTSTPRDPANQLYWNKEREIALLNLIYQNPGLLTAGQVVAQLVSHSAFADQAALLANGVKIAEKIRAKVKKLAAAAKTLGRPEPKLRRGAGGRPNDITEVFDAIFGPTTATNPAPIMPAPIPIIQQAQDQPIPLVPQPAAQTATVQPVMGGGLISIPG